LVVLAVKVTLLCEQMAPVGLGLILIDGVRSGLTVIVMLLLVAVAGLAQVALLVSITVITSPFARPPSVYELVLAPTLTPFFCHWNDGDSPPLVMMALNVTLVCAQMGPGMLGLMLTEGTKREFTDIVMLLLFAVVGLAHVALLVSRQVIKSPFNKPASV
jgi:hypothetical protein